MAKSWFKKETTLAGLTFGWIPNYFVFVQGTGQGKRARFGTWNHGGELANQQRAAAKGSASAPLFIRQI